jgi:hypothetical protein
VVSGTLTIYLLRQWKYAKTDLDRLQPQVTQMAAQFNNVSRPMSQFMNELFDFSRRNPDFAQILQKDGVRPTNPATAPATAKKK